MRSGRRSQHGASMVEFAIVVFLLITVIMAGLEFDRMLMVYNSLTNAACVGVRYAIVHGATRTGTGDPASGATDTSAVVSSVRSWARLGFLDPDKLNITVSYPASADPKTDPGNSVGARVTVAVTYPYDPLTFIPVNPTLKAASSGVIVF